MASLTDTFVDTAGVAVTSHTPTPSGTGSWAGSASTCITDLNRARTNTGGAGVSNILSFVPATAEYDVECDFVIFTMPGAGQYSGVKAFADTNSNTDGRRGYKVYLSNGGLFLYVTSSSSAQLATVAGATWNTGGGATAVYHVKLQARTVAAVTALTVYVTRSDGQYLKSDGTYQSGAVACMTATPVTAQQPGGSNLVPAIGKAGVFWLDTGGASNSTGLHIDNLVVTDYVAVLAALDAQVTTSTTTTIALAVGTVSGGSTPYTYQWSKSTTGATGTFNDIGGATTATYTATGLSANQDYWFKCVVTDNVSTTVTSGPVFGIVKGTPIVLGFIGDSISVGVSAGDSAPTMVSRMLNNPQNRLVTLGSNQAVSGSGTGSWVSGGAYLPGALTAFSGASVTHVNVQLGTNGSTGTTYTSNMQSMIADLLSAGYVVIIHDVPWFVAGTAANKQLLRDQSALNDALCNGTTVLRGAKLTFNYFAAHQSELNSDGVHPNATGKVSLGELWADAAMVSMFGTAAGRILRSGGMGGGING